MAYTTIVSGTNITSSWANASVRDQVVSPFVTSAARTAAITSPVAGMVSSLTTYDKTEGIEFYNSAGQWRKPWNMPWGIITTTAGGTSNLGYVVVTAAQTGITSTLVDLTNLSMTFDALANRLYRVSVHCNFYASQADNTASLALNVASSNVAFSHTPALSTGTSSLRTAELTRPINSAAAQSLVVKLQAQLQTGTGTVIMHAGAANVATMLIEDIGPSGAPS
jgi:hypothetical protein